MGFFSYQKDFAKNTEKFKTKVQDLMFKTGDVFGVGKLLNAVIYKLDEVGYPKDAKSKDIEAIDKRIDELLGLMTTDVQKKQNSKLSEHARMLISAIEDSRQYGKERYSEKALKSQYQMADCQGAIYDLLDNKGKISSQKEEILKRASKLSGPTAKAEQQKLGVQYNALDRQEKESEKQVNLLINRYNSLVQIVNAESTSVTIQALKTELAVDVGSYEKMIMQQNADIEQQIAIDGDIDDITKEADKVASQAFSNMQTGSSFDDLVEARKSSDLQNSLDNSSYESAEEDPFTKALRESK